jgi:hypothetical protein
MPLIKAFPTHINSLSTECVSKILDYDLVQEAV